MANKKGFEQREVKKVIIAHSVHHQNGNLVEENIKRLCLDVLYSAMIKCCITDTANQKCVRTTVTTGFQQASGVVVSVFLLKM